MLVFERKEKMKAKSERTRKSVQAASASTAPDTRSAVVKGVKSKVSETRGESRTILTIIQRRDGEKYHTDEV